MAGVSMVKMKKPGKRRALSASWEGPYHFVGHANGKGDFDFEEGSRICIVRDANGRQWERSRRDLQVYNVPPDSAEGLSFFKKGGVTYVAKQRVSGLELLAGEGMETETGINFAATFMSGGGFCIDLGIQTAGYAWAAWGMKVCLGLDP